MFFLCLIYSLVFLSFAHAQQEDIFLSAPSFPQRLALADPYHVFIRSSDHTLYILDCITGEEKAHVSAPQPFNNWDLTLDKRYLYFLSPSLNNIWFFDLLEWQWNPKEIPLEEDGQGMKILMHHHFYLWQSARVMPILCMSLILCRLKKSLLTSYQKNTIFNILGRMGNTVLLLKRKS